MSGGCRRALAGSAGEQDAAVRRERDRGPRGGASRAARPAGGRQARRRRRGAGGGRAGHRQVAAAARVRRRGRRRTASRSRWTRRTSWARSSRSSRCAGRSASRSPASSAGFSGSGLPAGPAWWISQVRAHLEQRAATSPVLVCLDDLQWACPATLAALRTLPQELKRHPVAWILARSTTRRQEAERLFGLLEEDGAARVRLAPLTEEEVAAAARGRVRRAAASRPARAGGRDRGEPAAAVGAGKRPARRGRGQGYRRPGHAGVGPAARPRAPRGAAVARRDQRRGPAGAHDRRGARRVVPA